MATTETTTATTDTDDMDPTNYRGYSSEQLAQIIVDEHRAVGAPKIYGIGQVKNRFKIGSRRAERVKMLADDAYGAPVRAVPNISIDDTTDGAISPIDTSTTSSHPSQEDGTDQLSHPSQGGGTATATPVGQDARDGHDAQPSPSQDGGTTEPSHPAEDTHTDIRPRRDDPVGQDNDTGGTDDRPRRDDTPGTEPSPVGQPAGTDGASQPSHLGHDDGSTVPSHPSQGGGTDQPSPLSHPSRPTRPRGVGQNGGTDSVPPDDLRRDSVPPQPSHPSHPDRDGHRPRWDDPVGQDNDTGGTGQLSHPSQGGGTAAEWDSRPTLLGRLRSLLSHPTHGAGTAVPSQPSHPSRRDDEPSQDGGTAEPSPAGQDTVPPAPSQPTQDDPIGRPAQRSRADRWYVIGLVAIAVPAFLAVWSGWVGLAEKTGWGSRNLLPGIAPEGGWATFDTSVFLGIGIEAYGALSLAVWLTERGRNRKLRRFALCSAVGSLVLGAIGQVAYHVMQVNGIDKAGPVITGFVAVLPVLVFGLATGLIHTLIRDRHTEGSDMHTP